MAERADKDGQSDPDIRPAKRGGLIAWLRALWFRLLLWLGRIGRLLAGRREARRVAAPRSRAPAAVAEGPPYNGINHPILRKLRRRALAELFDWLGLDYLPGELLERSDNSLDAVEALDGFLLDLGLEPLAVRHREPDALERLGEAVDLLMAFGPLTERLEAAQRERLQWLLYSGDFPRLREASAALFDLGAVLDADDNLGDLPRPASYQAFIEEVRRTLARMPEVTAAEAEAARRLSERYIRQIRVSGLLRRKIDSVFDALEGLWPQRAAEARQAQRRDDLATRRDEIVGRIDGAMGLGEAALDGLIEDLEALLAELQALLREAEATARAKAQAEAEARARAQAEADAAARARARAQAEAEARARAKAQSEAGGFNARAETEKVYRTEAETALAFLGFPLSVRPGAKEIVSAWRVFMKNNHPDLVQDPAQKQRREERCKEANRMRAILEREFAR